MSGNNMPPPPPGGPPVGGEHPRGTTVLILGILSIVCFQPLGIVAVIMGRGALREIDSAPPGRYTNRGLVQAGFICGIIGLALFVVSLLYLFAFGGLAAIMNS